MLCFALIQSVNPITGSQPLAPSHVNKEKEDSVTEERIANILSEAQDAMDSPTNKTWSCNDRKSGDYAATRWLLDHLGIDEQSVDVNSVRYMDLNKNFREGAIDIGVLCCGLNAPILKDVLCSGNAVLREIPFVDAFAYKHPSLVRDVGRERRR